MGEEDTELFEIQPCPRQDLNQFFNDSDQLALFRDNEDDDLLNEDDELPENDSMSK